MIINYPKRYVDLLGEYLIKDLDDFYIRFMDNYLTTKSVQEVIDNYIHVLDCSRYDKSSNFRLMQTIGHPYRIDMSKLVYFVMTYSDTDEVFEAIKTRHENNLRFELKNPPIIYDKKGIKVPKTVKTKRKTKEPKQKQTPEQKKEAKFNAKFAAFNIPKIKL